MSDTAGAIDVSSNVSNAHVADSVAAGETRPDTPDPTTGPADTAVGEQPTEGEVEQPKPSRDRRAEKRIASLTRKNDEAQREIGYWKALAEKSSQQPAAQANAKPQPNQYPSYDEYVDALTDWKLEQRLVKAEAPQPKEQPQPTSSKTKPRNEALVERLVESGKDIEDFQDVLRVITAPGYPISEAMRDYLEDAEQPALMAQWYADNPRKALRISGMDPVDAEAELDKVAATLARPARTTTAPPPGPTVGGRAVATRDPAKMDMDEYAAHWKQRNGIKD
jgi:hypothetical protein